MTTFTLKIDNDKAEFIEAFKIFIKNFKGVSYEIFDDNEEKEVLSSLSCACKDIKSQKAFKDTQSIEDFYQEMANG